MKTLAWFFLVAATATTWAQESPEVQVFGGYSLLHIDSQGMSGSTLDNECNLISPGLCPPGTFKVHNYLNGWDAAARFNVKHWLGVEGDFSGHYGNVVTLSSEAQDFLKNLGLDVSPLRGTSYSFLFGPVGYKRAGRYTPFAHALFGANRISGTISIPSGLGFTPSASATDTGFAMAFGGGLDLGVGHRIAVRLAQADYLYTKHDFSAGTPGIANHQNNLRISAGVVFSFGGAPEATHPSTGGKAKPAPIARGSVSVSELGVVVRGRESGAGVEVIQVTAGGSAETSGLKAGDVITQVDGKSVSSPAELQAAVAGKSRVSVGFLVRGMWQSEAMVTVK